MMPTMIFRLPLPALLILGSCLTIYSAQQNPTQSVNPALIAESERAVVRSQEDLAKARNLMKRAESLRAEKKLRQSFQLASEALDMSPTGSASAKIRTSMVNSYTTIAIEYARQLIDDGVFTDSIAETNGILDSRGQPISAESVLKSVLVPSVNPGNLTAKQMLSDLEQPAVYNKTITPKFASQRDEVTRLLTEASGFAESGRNDLAFSRYESVLTIDPYNTAARKGMEGIHNSGMKYADEAYNETRGRMLWQVEKAWERPPHKSKQGRTTESTGRQQDVRGTDQIIEKLNSIVIDKIDLSDSPISEAVEYLKQKSVALDPNKKGVNIFLKLAQPGTSSPGTQPTAAPTVPEQLTPVTSIPSTEPRLTLLLNHVPLYVALDYIAKLSNLKLKIDPYAVSIVPLSEPTDVMLTKEYQVPPTFIPPKSLDASGALPQPGSAGVPDPNKARVAQRMDAKDYLASQGVEFPPGASANYLAAGSKLVVRNTRDNIDVIDSLVDAAMGDSSHTQVDIQTKFLEINQNNLQELGFDWLLGPFSIGGGVYGGGGGNGANVNSSYYPFGNPYTQPANSAVMNPVGGIRSGDQSITGNSVDALLAGQLGASSAPAPGIFSIAGVFSEPQFQLVIRALNQKKGVDLMSAPKVTTKSGVPAKVKIVNEFIYPRQYTPPQIPQSTVNNGITTINGNGISTGVQTPPTITPSFPTDFTKQDLGVVLEAKPTIGPDGYTIDLELNPRVVDFDGFINYGSPINSIGYTTVQGTGGIIQTPIAQTLTTNTINQPVFSTREVRTFVTVWDSQTVALGGLIREDVQKVQNKVPFLGDVPLAGRLFRSETDQKFKKNLVIFVTPRILDADGQPRRGDVEEPDIVTPLGLPADLPRPTFSSPAIGGK